MQTEIDVF